MKRLWIPLIALIAAMPATASAQMSDGASLAPVRGLYESVRGYIIAAAEQMPEEDYSFRPTPEVRSFGELMGHIANAGYMFCAGATGGDRPSMGNAEELTSKAELVEAVKASFAYCDKAHAMDAAKADESVNFFGAEHTRLSVLAFNMGHNYEHYGNIVTYMRMNGMVPPSSQGGM
jgi:uncharacterized damage-inducible protein DinB